MKKITTPLAAAGLALALAGCGHLDGSSLPTLPHLGGSASAAGLPTGTWRLVTLKASGQTEVSIAQPELFTAEFGADGRVSLRADCNRCMGLHTAGSGTLTVGPMACTRAYCVGTAPLDTTYASLVSSAQTWATPDGQHLELGSAVGVLRFTR